MAKAHLLDDAGRVVELRRWASAERLFDRDALRLGYALDNTSPGTECFGKHIAHYDLRMKQWEERAETCVRARAPCCGRV